MNKREINKEFIDYLRLNVVTINWIFDKREQTEIVPKELTHDYLLSHFKIDENIYKYYHLPTRNLLSDSEFEKMANMGFCGKKETALRPYSNIIYGAYYSRFDMDFKLISLNFGLKPITCEGNEIKLFTDLIPYFKEYAKGFQNGFNEFDNTQIKPFLTMLAEKTDYVNKVFEFVTKQIFLSHSWATLGDGFATNQNNEIVNAFENGQKQGYFYRAWSIVFSNNNLFKPLFDEMRTKISEQLETKTDKLKAPVLGLFCSLINKIGIDKKDETESATVYCERICGKFKLPYTDRVRQNYNVNETKKLIQELTEKVLPLIDNEAKILIQKYLDSKQPPKQNLYA